MLEYQAFASLFTPCTDFGANIYYMTLLLTPREYLSARFVMRFLVSEAWGLLQFQEKHSRSEKAIFGALGKFRGKNRSNSRNSTFHSRNTKFHSRNGIPRLEQYENHISCRATPGAIPGIDGNPHQRISFLPQHSRSIFFRELRRAQRAKLSRQWISPSLSSPHVHTP